MKNLKSLAWVVVPSALLVLFVLSSGVWAVTTMTLSSDPQGRIDSYADLYEDGGGSAIAVATGGTYYKWTTSTVGTETGSDYADADVGSDDITIGQYGGGKYLVTVSMSMTGEVNAIVHCAVHLGGVKQENLSFNNNMTAVAPIQAASMSGILTLANTNVVDFRCTSDGNGDDVTVYHMNLTVARIGI